MKPVTSAPNMQNEITNNAEKIDRIKEILSCLLSEKTKKCKDCEFVDGCSHLQAAVFCIIKNG